MNNNLPNNTADAAPLLNKSATMRPSWGLCVSLMSLCAGMALSACASMVGSDPETQVRQRASERWQALVAGEFTRAYSYSTPSYRAVVSADEFRNRNGGAVKREGSEVVAVKCPETTRCIATIRIDFRPLFGGRFGDKINTHIDETWLLEGGQWWVFQSIKGN